MRDLISVIIPIYNVETYLCRCIDSVINQTYENIEILLIDDGSTDDSSKICDEYATKDNRVKVFHKVNGGQSDARNMGIDNATGAYITFIDSDDWISTNCLEVLYRSLIGNDADISIIETIETIGSKKSERSFSQGCTTKTIYNSRDALYVILKQKEFNVAPFAKLYRKELFRQFRFKKGIIYEDLELMYKILDEANIITYSNEAQYFYFLREGSTVHSQYDSRHFILIDIAKEMLDFIDVKYPDLHDAAMCRYVFSNILLLSKIYKNKDYIDKTRDICNTLLDLGNEIFKNKEINIKQKMKVMFIAAMRKAKKI